MRLAGGAGLDRPVDEGRPESKWGGRMDGGIRIHTEILVDPLST